MSKITILTLELTHQASFWIKDSQGKLQVEKFQELTNKAGNQVPCKQKKYN